MVEATCTWARADAFLPPCGIMSSGGRTDEPGRARTCSHAGAITRRNRIRTGFSGRCVLIFALLIVGANLWPSLFSAGTPRAEAVALKLGIYFSLPVAVVGAILGVFGIVQEARQKKFAKVGLFLCGLHALLCLFVLSR